MSSAERKRFNNKPIFSLSEICQSLRSVISKTYNQTYYIQAEIIKLNFYPQTGHCFPELVEKENEQIKAQMRGIIWAGNYRRISERFRSMVGEPLKDGINILCLATIEFSPQYGLALYIQDIEPSFTLGEMARNKKEVIDKLKKENVFDENKKKTLPAVPKRIAVISVETSKGYNDFMVTLTNNNWNYRFDTTLFPAVLQGDRAILTITEQLSQIEKKQELFDCVVIIRGGGGDVGLSCYDNYELARRVATFPLPVISGIGHSTNETVTELVSFANKITPTEVAYFLIQQFHDFALKVQDLQDRCLEYVRQTCSTHHQSLEKFSKELKMIGKQIITRQNDKIETFSRELRLMSSQTFAYHKEKICSSSRQLKLLSKQLIDIQKDNCESNKKQLLFLSQNIVEKQKEKLSVMEKQIALLHPDNVLKRGFSITYLNGHAVTDATELSDNQEIITKLYKGEITSIITSKK
ncbi:MAG: exodeoxyribonuclease VII large subunit [Bacteroidales bacterium]|nr:exodeoxyribonuclease VII large subunit [Bacteroidales bacterium]